MSTTIRHPLRCRQTCSWTYEQMQESMALLKMLALGNRQIDAGRVQPAADVIARLLERHQAE